ncbi:hypothetical protein ACOSP7_008737 [Xanthoceras sorbifolium]
MGLFLRRNNDLEKVEKTAFLMRNGEILLEKLIASCNGKRNPIRNFSSEEIKQATNDYDTRKVTKTDSLYELYGGFLRDRPISCFNNIVFASQMSHKNVLKLIGCCLETRVPILVFEPVAYRTLDDHIHGPRQPHFEPLLWTHSGIRPSGILLDEHFVAKLFDFSLAKSIPEIETQIKDSVLRGTLGYIAPEHINTALHNEKSDVYSFGALLLVLLTGQRMCDLSSCETE